MRPALTLLSVLCVAALAAACSSDGERPAGSSTGPGVVLEFVPDSVDSDTESDVARFAAIPTLLVTEDGQVLFEPTEGVVSQGSLVPDVWVRSITPAGVETVRSAVADDESPRDIDELVDLVGPELGDVELHFPEQFRFAAAPLGPAATYDDPDTPIIEWPATASIPLAGASSCTILPELEVGEAFITAAAGSVFDDQGTIYRVLVAGDWPGAPC